MSEEKAWVDIISGIKEEDLISTDIIDKLISDHRRAINSHNDEIALSERSIKNLQIKKEKLKHGSNTLIFQVAEKLELINTMNGNSLFEPAILNWANFVEDNEVNDAEHIYFYKAKQFIAKAGELNISIRKAFELMDEIWST